MTPSAKAYAAKIAVPERKRDNMEAGWTKAYTPSLGHIGLWLIASIVISARNTVSNAPISAAKGSHGTTLTVPCSLGALERSWAHVESRRLKPPMPEVVSESSGLTSCGLVSLIFSFVV